MGYKTSFSGSFKLNKQLSVEHLKKYRDFCNTRHENEWTAKVGSMYCQWIANEDGTEIEAEGQIFYEFQKWIKFLIANFFTTHGYSLTGIVKWQGEEIGDIGIIAIKDNEVKILFFDLFEKSDDKIFASMFPDPVTIENKK